jgi:hypothetical protein
MSSTATPPEVVADFPEHASVTRQCVRYALHLAAVYVIVHTTTLWLAGRVHDTVLPLIQQRSPADSSFQFAFSHLLFFSVFPALIVGFAYAQWYPHRVALLVWIVPLVILAYQFLTFPTAVFENHFAAAFHEYFGGEFVIGEFHNYRELFTLAASPDMRRGMQQLDFTAPVYAGIGYSVGTWLGMRYDIPNLTAAWRKSKPSLPRSD